MSSHFYALPKGIAKVLKEDQSLSGSIFVPYDTEDMALASQFTALGLRCVVNTKYENIFDDVFWIAHDKMCDYVICVTAGNPKLAEYVTQMGMLVANKAVIVLDRISFLEPVRKRRDFLTKHKCSNMVVLNPRPQYRQLGSSKDAVTSCWFTFKRKEDWIDGCHITYAVDWNACKPDLDDFKNRHLDRPDQGEQQETR